MPGEQICDLEKEDVHLLAPALQKAKA